MNKTSSILVAGAALTLSVPLLLSGCSSDAPVAGAATTTSASTSTPSATSIDRTHCNTNCPGDPGYVEPVKVTDASSEPTSTMQIMDPYNPVLNDRGNVQAEFGALGMDINPETFVANASFVLEGIQAGECKADDGFQAGESENGKILIIDMTVQAEPSTNELTPDPVYANSGGGVMSIILEDGSTWNGNPTIAGCVPSTNGLPATVLPGEKRVGKMALDVPTDAEAVVYRPTLGQGYEYKLPN